MSLIMKQCQILVILGMVLLLPIWSSCSSSDDEPKTPPKQGRIPSVSEAIDLGIGVKFAPHNLGASKPEEFGDYYAWGETEPKESFTWANYKWCNGTDDSMTKYCDDAYYGTVDNLKVLEEADDAASVQWGQEWRIPSDELFYDLYHKCKWKWTTLNDVNGYKVTGPNGNSIFLPAAGFGGKEQGKGMKGLYWYRELNVSDCEGRAIEFGPSQYVLGGCEYRKAGASIRPVCD